MDVMSYIRHMNLAALDLNLLVALDALLAESHVGRAAHRVGLSQPAMSHALKRLRELTGDPLLVRFDSRMELTPRAEQLRAPLAAVLDQVRAVFAPGDFDPASSDRTFCLMMPDIVVDLLLSPLTRELSRSAPGVRLKVVPWHGPSILTREMARTIDFGVACLPDAFPGFRRERLYRDADALAVRAGHPEGARLEKLARFLGARHVAVVGHGAREDMIDEWLGRLGHVRKIAVVVPSYLQALHVAAQSDLVAFVPRRLIASAAKPLKLRLVPPPLDPGVDEQFLFYPLQAEADPGSAWLRNVLLAIGRRLEKEAPRS